MPEDKVSNTHSDYDATAKARKTFCDVCCGTEKMRKGSIAYLPKWPAETQDSYDLRKDTATLLNVTKKTVDTLCGLVFQRDLTLDNTLPEIQGTDTADGLIENIDNEGNHINVFARDVFEDSFDGYSAILVDSPTAQANDLAQQKSLGIQPYWVDYCADDIINWDYQINPISKKKELSLIVFKECKTKKLGQFLREEVVQYRVFMLNESHKVVWQLWEERDNGKGEKEAIQIVPDTIIESQDEIPVAIIGELGSAPPLMDLAFKNIEHYQSYSDYKSIIHKTCVPLLYTVNLDGDPKPIGGDTWWKLTEGGSMGFAEPSGASIDKVQKSLSDIERQMALLGLAMLDSNRRQGAEVTATEMQFDTIQETSSLQVRATQLQDALERALGYTAKYLGKDAESGGSVELGATWAELVLGPIELQAFSSMVELGQFSLQSFLWMLEKAGKLPPDVTADDELATIDEEQKKLAETQPVINAGVMPNGQPNTKKPPTNAGVPVAG